MDAFEYDEFIENLDKCSCGSRPKVIRRGDYVSVRCPNPNCGRVVKPEKQEWRIMVVWNKMVRE